MNKEHKMNIIGGIAFLFTLAFIVFLFYISESIDSGTPGKSCTPSTRTEQSIIRDPKGNIVGYEEIIVPGTECKDNDFYPY